MTKKPKVYFLQNKAIHEARRQLENQGVLDPWDGVNQIRKMAAELNLGIASISNLSLLQREALIERLIQMGGQVRNPHIYESDLKEEAMLSESKEPRKIILFSEPSEAALRKLDTLANQVRWHTADGYLRLCYKLFKAPRPRNSREVTKLRLVLQSLLKNTPPEETKKPELSTS